MKNILIPHWLQKILDETGLEQGNYVFDEAGVVLGGLPEEYVGIAGAGDEGLAVSKNGDGIIYRWIKGNIEVYAVDEQEFVKEIRRDEAWEELSENMPATKLFGLGIVITTKQNTGEKLVLGFKGSSRDSAMVIQGQMRPEEMLADALKRELEDTLSIPDYQIIDVIDDGGELEYENTLLPMFTVVVQVDDFDLGVIDDERVGWITQQAKKVLN